MLYVYTIYQFIFWKIELKTLRKAVPWMGGSPGEKWRTCEVGGVKEGLENDLWRRWSNGRVGECAVTWIKRRKGWRISCDVGEAMGRLENESFSTPLILQPFRHFIYVTIHSRTLPSLYLRHSSFSNPSVASLTSQLILQPFFRFSYVAGSSLTSPGEPPMNSVLFLFSVFLKIYSVDILFRQSILTWTCVL